MITNSVHTKNFIAGLWGKSPVTVIEAPVAGEQGVSFDGIAGTTIRTPQSIAVADGPYLLGAQLRATYIGRRSGKRPERCVISLREQIRACPDVSLVLLSAACAAEFREAGDSRFHAVHLAAEMALALDAYSAAHAWDCLGRSEIEGYPAADQAVIREMRDRKGYDFMAFGPPSWLLDPLRQWTYPDDKTDPQNLGSDERAVDAFLSEIRITWAGKLALRHFAALKLSVLACLARLRDLSPDGHTPDELPLPAELRPAVRELIEVHREPRRILALKQGDELYGRDRRMPDPEIVAWAEQS